MVADDPASRPLSIREKAVNGISALYPRVEGFKSTSNSQFGKDLLALGVTNFKIGGYFVEFGCCDGMVGSNSYLLERDYAWQGILAEPAECDDILNQNN